jgi:hypothetical protein
MLEGAPLAVGLKGAWTTRSDVGGVARVFWVDPHKLVETRESTTSVLPSVQALGLRSQVAQFKKVVLWTYGQVLGAPPQCAQQDARCLVPIDTTISIINLHGHAAVSQVSDCVRILAVATYGGWVVDCDNVWLRPPPYGEKYSYQFATLMAKRSGRSHGERYWSGHEFTPQPDLGWDGRGYLGTPFTFPRGTAFASDARLLVCAFLKVVLY